MIPGAQVLVSKDAKIIHEKVMVILDILNPIRLLQKQCMI